MEAALPSALTDALARSRLFTGAGQPLTLAATILDSAVRIRYDFADAAGRTVYRTEIRSTGRAFESGLIAGADAVQENNARNRAVAGSIRRLPDRLTAEGLAQPPESGRPKPFQPQGVSR